MSAIHFCQTEAVKKYIDEGDDVNIQLGDDYTADQLFSGYTALHTFQNVYTRCPELLDILLNAGANINEVDDNGFTPFQLSVNACRENAVQKMIERKAGTKIIFNDAMKEKYIYVRAHQPNCQNTLNILKKAGIEVDPVLIKHIETMPPIKGIE